MDNMETMENMENMDENGEGEQKEEAKFKGSDDQKEEQTPRSNLRRPLTSATTMTQPAEVIG